MTLTLEVDRRTNEVIVTGPDLLIRFDGQLVNLHVMGAIGKLLNEVYEAGRRNRDIIVPPREVIEAVVADIEAGKKAKTNK